MADINQLSSTDTLNAGDLVPVWKTNNGDTRKTSMTTLQAYMQNNLTFPTATGQAQFVVQYAAPVATGFTVTLPNNSNNQWLILSPTGGFAAGTITFPLLANLADNQEIIIACTQAITALTINGNGATVIGAPATVSQFGSFRFKYNALGAAWYRLDEDSPSFSAFGLSLINDADAAAGRATLGLSTSDNPQFATIELGAASDTTLSRSAAGVLAVEGVVVPTISSANTLTNKTLSSPTLSGTVAGTPTFSGAITIATGGVASSTDLTIGNSLSTLKLSGGDGTYAFIDSASWGVAIRTQNTNRIVVSNAGAIDFLSTVTMADATNIVLNTTTGTKFGTATGQKIGFYNATPVIQQAGTGETVGFTAGSGTAVNDDSTFTGNVGATAYRISDVVKALKNLGLLAS